MTRRPVKKPEEVAETIVEDILEEDEAEDEEEEESIFDDDDGAPVSENDASLSILGKTAKAWGAFRSAPKVLTQVKAVPTIFPGLNWATRVGGLPIERFTLVHGPSGEGKTKLTIGLLLSFLMRKHLACLIDAERTTPITWLRAAMGPYAFSDGFFAERPKTYELTIKYVRDFLNTLRKLRDAGKLPDDTSALIVVDSIRKLVPEDIFKRIMTATKAAEEAAGGKSGTGQGTNRGKPERVGRDRGSMIKAQMNSAWMDELIPLLEEASAGMVVIARETMDPEASQADKMWGNDFKVGGGSALYYDASLVMRVERQRLVTKSRTDEEKASGVKAVVYGERHRVTIRKSKVSGKEDAQTQWYFHDSSGVLIPVGFDRARDLIELAQKFKLIKTKAAWLMWNGNKWQGEHKAVQKLTANPELMNKLEMAVSEKYTTYKPLEFSSSGEILSGDVA
jgi:hypothetical protein